MSVRVYVGVFTSTWGASPDMPYCVPKRRIFTGNFKSWGFTKRGFIFTNPFSH